MKTFYRLLILAAALAAAIAPAPAAINTLTSTTLSQSLNASSGALYLASITGVNGPGQPVANGSISVPTGYAWTILFVDKEAIRVTVAPTTSSAPVYVERGWDGTPTESHNSGALVYISNPSWFTAINPGGACVAATTTVLPLINYLNGTIWNCNSNGLWVQVGSGTDNQGSLPTSSNAPFTSATTFPLNSIVAPVNLTTDVSGKLFYSQLFAPVTETATGACILAGSGAGSPDNVILALYSNTGTLLANTALAGTALASASNYNCIAFTAPYTVIGPQTYFLAVQGGGTGSNQFYVYTTKGAPNTYITGSQTGGTFGTLAAISSPATAFTATVGPVMSLY